MTHQPSESEEQQHAEDNHSRSKSPVRGDGSESSGDHNNSAQETEPSPDEVNRALQVLGLAAWEDIKRAVWPIVKSPAFWTALATVAIAVFTWQLVTYSGRQWRSMQDQLHASERQTIIDDRPWVGMTNFDIEIAPGEKTSIFLTIVNIGKTPLRHLRVWVNFLLLRKDQNISECVIRRKLNTPERRDAEEFNSYVGDMMNPAPSFAYKDAWTQKYYFSSAHSITDVQLEQLQSGDLVFYGFSNFEYDDFFGNHLWTHFCDYYLPIRFTIHVPKQKAISKLTEKSDLEAQPIVCPDGVWYGTTPPEKP